MMDDVEVEAEVEGFAPVVVELPEQNDQSLKIDVKFDNIPKGMAPRRWIFTLVTEQTQEEMDESMRLYLHSKGRTVGLTDDNDLNDFYAELSAPDAKLILTKQIPTPIEKPPQDLKLKPK